MILPYLPYLCNLLIITLYLGLLLGLCKCAARGSSSDTFVASALHETMDTNTRGRDSWFPHKTKLTNRSKKQRRWRKYMTKRRRERQIKTVASQSNDHNNLYTDSVGDHHSSPRPLIWNCSCFRVCVYVFLALWLSRIVTLNLLAAQEPRPIVFSSWSCPVHITVYHIVDNYLAAGFAMLW